MSMSAFRKMKLQRERAEKAKLELEAKEVSEVSEVNGVNEVSEVNEVVVEEPIVEAKTDAEKLKKKK